MELVRSLAADMGEDFEVRTYERFTSLELEPEGLGDGGYSAIKPGDCIVAFSRRDIFRIKQVGPVERAGRGGHGQAGARTDGHAGWQHGVQPSTRRHPPSCHRRWRSRPGIAAA